MAAVLSPHKAFAVWYKDLDRWDPTSFRRISWKWPKDVMRSIGSVLRPRKEKVDRVKYRFSDLQPMTIHFDGSVDKREVDPSREYTMDLFFAHPGDIVVAKIDLKNGAVAIVPDWKNVVVTGHFAVYEPDRSKVLPEYFLLIIQTGFFKEHLWRNKVGAEGRKEVKLEFFEAQEIPLPPMPVQEGIVSHWKAAQESAAKSTVAAAKLESETLTRFFTRLGLKPPKMEDVPKAFAVSWKDFFRWSVSYNQAVLDSGDLPRGKYPVTDLGELLSYVQYGTSEKANSLGRGTPIIRMNNIKNGLLDLADLKHIEINANEREKLLLRDGDILFNRTNSKELVGKCAVFHETGEYIFASYLIRLKVRSERALPDYVAFFLNSPLGRQQINALSRHIIGQANINSEELKGLQISVPPVEVQREIVDMVNRQRQRMAEESRVAEEWRTRATREVEEIILGIRPVPHDGRNRRAL